MVASLEDRGKKGPKVPRANPKVIKVSISSATAVMILTLSSMEQHHIHLINLCMSPIFLPLVSLSEEFDEVFQKLGGDSMGKASLAQAAPYSSSGEKSSFADEIYSLYAQGIQRQF